MSIKSQSIRAGKNAVPTDLMLPTDYPLKEALGIYARRLGILLTGSAMILGIGVVGAWASILLAPSLYLSSSRLRAILRNRLNDGLVALLVIAAGIALDWIVSPSLLGSVTIYALTLAAVVLIFKRN